MNNNIVHYLTPIPNEVKRMTYSNPRYEFYSHNSDQSYTKVLPELETGCCRRPASATVTAQMPLWEAERTASTCQ